MTFLCPRIVLPEEETSCNLTDLPRSCASDFCSELQLPACGVRAECDVSKSPAGLNNLIDILNKSPETFTSFLRSLNRSRSCDCLRSDHCDEGRREGDRGASPYSDEGPQLEAGSGSTLSSGLRAGRGLRQSSRGFDISSGGIRVLLFRECERRGRKLLYDSSTVLVVPVTSLSFADSSAPLTTAPVRGLAPISLKNVPSEPAASSPPHAKLASTRSSSSSLRPASSSGPKSLAQSLSLGAVLSSPSPASGPSRPAMGAHKGVPLAATREASKSSDPVAPAAGPRAGRRSVEPRRNEIIMEITEDYVYQYCRQASDSKQLGELVFGCVQLAYRGPCCKLHQLGDRVVLSRTQPRPPAPSSRGALPPLPSATVPHPTLASDAGISSLGSSLEVLGRRVSGAAEASASDVSFYLGASSSTDRRLLAGDRRPPVRPDGSGLRRTSTVISDLRSSLGGLSVLSSVVGGGVPDSVAALRRTSTTPSEDDSGFGGPASWFSSHGGSFVGLLSLPVTPVGSVSSKGSLNSSSGSLSNLQKRFLRRTADTSLDRLTGSPSLAPLPRDGDAGPWTTKSSSFKRKDSPQLCRDAPAQCGSGAAGDTGSSAPVAAASHTRVGLAVVLSPESQGLEDRGRGALERWVAQHAVVLESSINRLQAELDVAYHNTSCFVSRAHAAVAAFQREVLDLLYGPRLIAPVWLQLLTSPRSPPTRETGPLPSAPQTALVPAPRAAHHHLELSRRRAVGEALVNSLGLLLREHDTKQTNFFMSRLLTAVLTYHLGWVTSVALQQDAAASRSPVGLVDAPAAAGGDSDVPPSACPAFFQQAQENESGVMTQLLELQGCLGCPPLCCRTVLLGSSASLLQHCLSLLSYFIRCQQVEERDVLQERSLDLFREEESSAQSVGACCFPDPHDATAHEAPAAQGRSEDSRKAEASSQSKSTSSGGNGVSRNSSEVTLQRSPSDGSGRRSSGDSSGRRSSGDSNGRRSSGDSHGIRLSGDSSGRRLSGDSSGRRLSGDSSGRRSSGDSSGRRSSGDSNGRRPSGDSSGRRPSGDSNSSLAALACTTLHRKRPSIHCCSSTALETLSELPSAEPPSTGAQMTSAAASVTQVQTTSFTDSEHPSCVRDGDKIFFGDLTGFREVIHPCKNAPAGTISSTRKHVDTTPTTVSWQILPSVDSRTGSRKQAVQSSDFRTLSYDEQCELGNTDFCVDPSSNIRAPSPVGFRKSKTSLNLSLPTGSSPKVDVTEESQKPLDESAFNFKVSHTSKISGTSSDTSTLYPDLTTLDGHREVFGPAEIQPDVIAAKVRKLCRVTPERLVCDPDKGLEKSAALSYTPEVKSSTSSEELPLNSEAQGAVQQVAGSVKINSKTFGGEVRFRGEMIRSEPEDGKKVIFIVGEDEVLDGASSSSVAASKLRRSCSPHPPDFLKMKESRNVARAFCLEELTRENFAGVYRSGSERRLRRDLVLGHKRTSSDPTARRPSALASAACHPVPAAVDVVSAGTEQAIPTCAAAEPVTSSCFRNPVDADAVDITGSKALTSICCSMTSEASTLVSSVSSGITHSPVSCEVRAALATPHVSTMSETWKTNVVKDTTALGVKVTPMYPSQSQTTSQRTSREREGPAGDKLTATSTSSLAGVDDTELQDSNFDCVFVSEPSVTVCQRGSVLGVAESVMGGVLDRYSPVFLLQAVINTDSEHCNSRTRPISTTTSSPHLVSEGSLRSSDLQSPASGRPSEGLSGLRLSPSSSSLEREASVSRAVPSVHSTLSFASSLFGTSPTRLFSGLAVKNPLVSAATDRRSGPGVRSSEPFQAVKSPSESAKSKLLKSLQHNLKVDTRYSQLKANHVAILADLDDWSVRVVTSDNNGVAVGMSPLIASITDSLLQLVLLGAQPRTVLQCLEDKLGEVYRQSLILANYLLEGTTMPFDLRVESDSSAQGARPKVSINPGRLADLPTALGLDLNDLPLLLATASSHSPHLATMYGLAIR